MAVNKLSYKVTRDGYCCLYGFMSIQYNLIARQNPALTPKRVSERFNVTPDCVTKAVASYDRGSCRCEEREGCLKSKIGRRVSLVHHLYLTVRYPVRLELISRGRAVYHVTCRDLPEIDEEVEFGGAHKAAMLLIAEALEARMSRGEKVPQPTIPLEGEMALPIHKRLRLRFLDHYSMQYPQNDLPPIG